MTSELIINALENINNINSKYTLLPNPKDNCYWGKNIDGCIVYMIPSKVPNLQSVYQETNSIFFAFNSSCTFKMNDNINNKIMHIFVCKEKSISKIDAFVRLTQAFANSEYDNDQYFLVKLFNDLSSLFDTTIQTNKIEIQGIFTELYLIKYFIDRNIDISKFWQSKAKMKFDFYVSSSKRIEVKSTIKQTRVHHFSHDQLNNDMYDIVIASVMLQSSDTGLSILDLRDELQSHISRNYTLSNYVESIVAKSNDTLIMNSRFDNKYIDENIKFFKACKIPSFRDSKPDGLINAKYECVLNNIEDIDLNEMIEWIGGDYCV